MQVKTTIRMATFKTLKINIGENVAKSQFSFVVGWDCKIAQL